MTNRLECAGVVLEGHPGPLIIMQQSDSRGEQRSQHRVMKWTVDGEPMKDAEYAVETFFARIYPSSMELPQAITKHIRVFAGLQLAAPDVMVRRAREHGGFKSQRAFARAAGVDHTTVARIESGRTDPTASTLFKLMHAGYVR